MPGRSPVPGSALPRHPHCAPINHARRPLSGLPSGQTQVQGLPQTPLPEHPAPAQSSSPAAVSAPGHWLAHRHVPVSAAPSPALCQRGMLSEAALAAVQRGQREALPHQTFRLSSCCRSLHAMTIETTGWRDLRFAALTDKPETATWYLADTSVFSGSYKEQCGNPS